MKFSINEIKDLLAAWVLIAIAFTILFSGNDYSLQSLSMSFFISLSTAGMGFLLHELMHKFVAQNYRLWAEFKANYSMLMLAIAFSFLGFILAAPGTVYIRGNTTKEKNGKISLAGPVTNIVLAILFLIPAFIMINEPLSFWKIFWNYGFKINALLALFNMIPAMPFDGVKVYAWNKTVYTITIVVAALLFFGSFFV